MDEAKKTEIVDALKLAHSGLDLFALEADEGRVFVVYRRASGDERRIYRQLREKGSAIDAQDSLTSCALYPDKAAFKKLLEEAPFFIETFENAVLAASGIYLDAQRKKL